MTQLIGSGEIAIPGFMPKPIEVPADVLGDPPAPPQLTKLIMGGPTQAQPQIPVNVIKTYHAHPNFGPEFQRVVAALHEEFGFSEPDCSVPHDINTPKKKPKRHNDEPMSTKKKPKVDAASKVEPSTEGKARLDAQCPRRVSCLKIYLILYSAEHIFCKFPTSRHAVALMLV